MTLKSSSPPPPNSLKDQSPKSENGSDELSAQNLADFYLGIEQFNNREFFGCHETLEKIWVQYKGSQRELIQGIIQLAVAYHHLLHGNKKGALKLMHRALYRLAKYPPTAMRIHLADLSISVKSNIKEMGDSPNLKVEEVAIPRVRLL
jgi:hypothetical protein